MGHACIERTLAREAGSSHYETGKPCGRGHVGPRRTDNAACAECQRVAAKAQHVRQKAAGWVRPSRSGTRPAVSELTPCQARDLQTLADGGRLKRRDTAWKAAQALGVRTLFHAMATALRRGLID